MTPKQKTKLSKFLSLVLRHKPEVIGITLDAEGWANVSNVLTGLKQHFAGVSLSVLKEIVAEDAKQRYALDEHRNRIRANQGHSIDVDLSLIAQHPPEFLFHGTSEKSLPLIRKDGLLPMSRQYVHLSPDPQTAATVGKRHGVPAILLIKAEKMSEAGFQFFKSDNGVWLTKHVPIEFLNFPAPCVYETLENTETNGETNVFCCWR